MAIGEDILRKEMELLKQDLVAKHLELGMKASGKWIETLENKTERLSGVMIGQKYTQQLVSGREPGKFPPIALIIQWIKDKGIKPFDSNMKISSLAFLIARKISKVGTKYFRDGGTDLVDAVITPERIQSIIDKVTRFQINLFSTDLENTFKKMAA